MRSGFPLHPTPRRAVYRVRGSRAPVRRRAPRRRRGLAPLLQPPPAHARRAARPGTLPLPAAPPAPGPCRRQKRGRGPAPSPSAPATPVRFQKTQALFPGRVSPKRADRARFPAAGKKRGRGPSPFPERPGDAGSLPKNVGAFPDARVPEKSGLRPVPPRRRCGFPRVGAQPAASSRRAPQRPSGGRTPASAASSATCQRK